MAATPEDEIYSIMFSSLKHPVRRKILRMLGSKPMTFMELVEELGISTPNLTYHLESLGELVLKMDNGQYRLSAFGLASVSAMRGVEDVSGAEPKRRWLPLGQRVVFGGLLIVIVVLASFTFLLYSQNLQLAGSQQALFVENQQLLSWGVGTDEIAGFMRDITHIDTHRYTVSLLSNTLKWRADFGGVSEEVAQYSLTGSAGDLNVLFRFRDGHFSRYELNMIESAPVFTQTDPDDLVLNARGILTRYRDYSGDVYLGDMLHLLDKVNGSENQVVSDGNLKLRVFISGGSAELLWMYTENGVDFQSKGLQMTFQNNILTSMTDGYFLFTVGSSDVAVSEEAAVKTAESYVRSLTWTIEGKQVSGFKTLSPPLSVQMVPHTRGDSVALIPYWYVELTLDQTYSGGINKAAVGIYADTGEVADVQMLSGSIEIQPS
jgi:hypothetical protein